MSDQMSLGGILDESTPPPAPPDTPPAVPEPAPAPTPEPAAAAPERARGPDGKFVTKEAAPETPAPAAPAAPAPVAPQQPPAYEMTPQYRAAIAQANDERHKRQALERRLAEIEAAKPQEPAKTFWDDPEGMLKTFESRIDGAVMTTRLNTAEAIARSKYPDFDEKIAVFAEILNQTPGLHQQWLSSPDPAAFAYSTGKNHIEFRQVGSMDAMRAQIEKETRVKLEAEFKARADAEAAQRAAIPGSLSSARSTGPTHQTWSGPSTLSDILTDK